MAAQRTGLELPLPQFVKSVLEQVRFLGAYALLPITAKKSIRTGHFIYECKSTRPYVSRPSRTQQLENPRLLAKLKAEGKPSVEVPEEFKNKSGTANKILENKEKERLKEIKDKGEGPSKKRARRSSSSPSSSSSSDSDSDSSSGSSSESESGSSSGSDSVSSRSRERNRKRRIPRRASHSRSRSVSSEASDESRGRKR